MATGGTLQRIQFAALHQPQGWLSPGFVEVDAQGRITFAGAQPPASWAGHEVEQVQGAAIPGLPNVHSHAFQRALSGLVEQGDPARSQDSFWTWRTTMYRLAAVLSPEDVEAISAWLFVEMLQSGMTHVGEFHYLHHGVNGVPYAQPEEMALRLHAASRASGLGLTMLPVFYAHAGIGKEPLPHQARFIHKDVPSFMKLWEATRRLGPTGVAPHSLRAVSAQELDALVAAVHDVDDTARIHIHAAEQPAEVEEVLAHLGKRPVEHLVEKAGADARWCLIHATHLTPDETTLLARSSAVAGLCPTTEANLGDGIFPALEFVKAGGVWAVGSDSHASISASQELQLLEYGQRLTRGRRNVLMRGGGPSGWSTGRSLWDAAVHGGHQALGLGVAGLVPGAVANVVVLDVEHPSLCALGPASWLDGFIFGGHPGAMVKHVMVRGAWAIRDGHHAQEDALRSRYVSTLRRLKERL